MGIPTLVKQLCLGAGKCSERKHQPLTFLLFSVVPAAPSAGSLELCFLLKRGVQGQSQDCVHPSYGMSGWRVPSRGVQ